VTAFIMALSAVTAVAVASLFPLEETADERLGRRGLERRRDVYHLFVGRLKAGELELARIEPSQVIVHPVEMRMRSTNPLLEAAHPVREYAVSQVDTLRGYSEGYGTQRREGRREISERYDFDYGRGVFTCERESGGKRSTAEHALSGPAQDPVSWRSHVARRIAAGERRISFLLARRSGLVEIALELGPEEEVALADGRRALGLRADASSELAEVLGATGEGAALWFDAKTGLLLRAEWPSKLGKAALVLAHSDGLR
jgi:hypothetical protein